MFKQYKTISECNYYKFLVFKKRESIIDRIIEKVVKWKLYVKIQINWCKWEN